MAAAFVISGATDSEYNSLYAKTAHVYSGKPVYQKGGSDGYVLFQPFDPGYSYRPAESYWMVGDSGHATSCVNTGYLSSYGNGGVCPDSPDCAGCAGKWREWDVHVGWVNNPSLTVVASQGRQQCWQRWTFHTNEVSTTDGFLHAGGGLLSSSFIMISHTTSELVP